MTQIRGSIISVIVLTIRITLPVTVGLTTLIASDTPREVPVTRPEMKQLIEDVKVRTPRIPLPELTEADREALGEDADSYESRLRYHYLNGMEEPRTRRTQTNPALTGRAEQSRQPDAAGRIQQSSRDQDPRNTLDSGFKVELFWIVSRANNCQYCLGHQESKLLAAGRSEDRIASLDTDWSLFTAAEKAAFAFARRFTYEPHLLSDADIVGLKEHYTEHQILEMILSMAGNNSINRWKEGVGVPQRKDEGGYSRLIVTTETAAGVDDSSAQLSRGTYLTPTSKAFASKVSIVAPIVFDKSSGRPTSQTVCERPPLESRQQVNQMLAACRTRNSRLSLVDHDQARKALAASWTEDAPLPNWARLLAHFPESGGRRVRSISAAWQKGDLSPVLRAQLSWIIARQDRAWYALGLAQNQLLKLGETESRIDQLDGDWELFTPRERALFVVARKLAASPVVLTDAEVADAVKLAGPKDVVQVVSYTTNQASFNRITEAAGLPLED